MEVYRICLAKYADALVASGYPARWNVRGQFVIYAAGSRALACLENVVHRSGEGLSDLFKVVRIEFPDDLTKEELLLADLPADWQLSQNYARCQPIGAAWYARRDAAVLRVPSSVIAHEFNYIFNTQHPDFAKVRLAGREDFVFDPRIKQDDPH
ncbi:RES family NAD+ phosphorylase [Hymenobacter sp. ASUV-10]|uniref:RES family NAD+ phosphorylase n=1 Tax=Hymenobacter aranciens TaxID=3063996 RepID=A0ABT9B6A7_9BACT|nr:RES family NAD+ phosphorylase [Hymenobacter sp. ASUV-10]MDO7873755.1 RES family NAD+ phosphorylase [Hymenobacter sp. ASUV-10]